MATMLGAAFLGALVFGRIADILGRKRVYWLVAAIMTVAAIGSAFAPSLPLLIGASALDVASTRSAVGNGSYEANPLYGRRPSLARLVTIKAAFDLPVVLGSHFLDRRTSGDSRWRRAEVFLPSLAVAIPQFWAAHHNWTLRKAQ